MNTNEILTPAMKELIANLGKLVKEDERCKEIERTIEAYEKSEELSSLIGEYNTQQNLLADAYSKESTTEEFKEAINARIDALYDQITNHPTYLEYVEAKTAFDSLTQEIYAELQFVVTGTRPCSHDCSSCHSDCDHHH